MKFPPSKLLIRSDGILSHIISQTLVFSLLELDISLYKEEDFKVAFKSGISVTFTI